MIDGIVEHAQSFARLVRSGDGEYRLRSLLKVYDWALSQLPFKIGDRVTVYVGPFKSDHGYAPYNDLWLTRPSGAVEQVHFNGTYTYWSYLVRFDNVRPSHLFSFSEEQIRLEQDLDL